MLVAYGSDSEKGDETPPEEGEAEEPTSKRARFEEAEEASARPAPVERFVLPPEPEGEVNEELAKRLAQWKARGQNPTQQIRQNREFANPQILQKIVEYFGINDIASCYPKDVFDPDAIVARRARDKSAEAEAPAAAAPPA